MFEHIAEKISESTYREYYQESDKFINDNFEQLRDCWHPIDYLLNNKDASKALDLVNCIIWCSDQEPPKDKKFLRCCCEELYHGLWSNFNKVFSDEDGDHVIADWMLEDGRKIWFKIV